MIFRKSKRNLKILSSIALCFIILNLFFFYAYRTGLLSLYDEKMVEARMDRRFRQIAHACEHLTYNKTPPVTQDDVVRRSYIDLANNITWCPMNDYFSQTWEKKLKGYGFPTIRKKMGHSKRLLITRHPFDRLLTIYRDKIQNKKAGEESLRRHVMQQNGFLTDRWVHSNYTTFHEFLLFVLFNRNYDESWKPVNLQCLPCNIHYDYIIKRETLGHDSRYLFEKLNISYDSDLYNHEYLSLLVKNNYGIFIRYYSKVSKQVLQDIYAMYIDDFNLFKYSPNYYYDMAKKDKEEKEDLG